MNTWADEPSLADVQRQYPEWRCWRAVSGLVYAQRCDLAPGTGAEVQGEDPLDLRDQIRRIEALDER